jgi:hypothetical protein
MNLRIDRRVDLCSELDHQPLLTDFQHANFLYLARDRVIFQDFDFSLVRLSVD